MLCCRWEVDGCCYVETRGVGKGKQVAIEGGCIEERSYSAHYDKKMSESQCAYFSIRLIAVVVALSNLDTYPADEGCVPRQNFGKGRNPIFSRNLFLAVQIEKNTFPRSKVRIWFSRCKAAKQKVQITLGSNAPLWINDTTVAFVWIHVVYELRHIIKHGRSGISCS